ncbi:MAG TPA: glycosyltransferase [Terriglobia bacterium]|nr:glycosyltransferase [Terriglobia bacterium]
MENDNPQHLKILILTVAHGASHQRASNALRTALVETHPEVKVEVVDALDRCTRWFRAYYNSYEIPLKYWPGLWRWIENYQDRKGATSPGWLNRRGARPLFKFINEFDPDIVVATEVGICELAALHKRESGARYRLAGLELMDFHPSWVQPEVDLFIATHEDLAAELVAAGAPAPKVVTTGQPIQPVFITPPTLDSARIKLGLDLEIPMLLILFGGAGLGKPKRVLKEIKKLDKPFQVVFIAGRNRRMEKEIRKHGRGLAHCCVLGWVDNMHEWMAAASLLLSKPGGSTLTEGFCCGLPMLAYDPHPGNEVKTCGWIEKWKVGLWIKRAEELAPTLERLLDYPEELAQLREHALGLARPRAAYDAAEAIVKLAPIARQASTSSG